MGAPSYGTLACPNVEAYGIDLVTVPVTVQLADRYNNPAPDGTSVAFMTNGGHIGGSCTTPSEPPGRRHVPGDLDQRESPAHHQQHPAGLQERACEDSGHGDRRGVVRRRQQQTGYYQAGDPFSDLGEPYLDANESGAYVQGDYFLNFYNTRRSTKAPAGVHRASRAPATHVHRDARSAIGVSHLLIMSTSVRGHRTTPSHPPSTA